MIQKLISGGQEVNLSSFSASCFGYKIEAAKLTPNTYQAANDLVSTYVSTKEEMCIRDRFGCMAR